MPAARAFSLWQPPESGRRALAASLKSRFAPLDRLELAPALTKQRRS
jgi:hypothetical protein